MKTCKECKWFSQHNEHNSGTCYAWGFVQEQYSDGVHSEWPVVNTTQRECFRFASISSQVSHYTRIELHN